MIDDDINVLTDVIMMTALDAEFQRGPSLKHLEVSGSILSSQLTESKVDWGQSFSSACL